MVVLSSLMFVRTFVTVLRLVLVRVLSGVGTAVELTMLRWVRVVPKVLTLLVLLECFRGMNVTLNRCATWLRLVCVWV